MKKVVIFVLVGIFCFSFVASNLVNKVQAGSSIIYKDGQKYCKNDIDFELSLADDLANKTAECIKKAERLKVSRFSCANEYSDEEEAINQLREDLMDCIGQHIHVYDEAGWGIQLKNQAIN